MSGDTPVLSLCFLLRNPGPKLFSVLEHCCEGQNQLLVLLLFGLFPSYHIPKAMNDVHVHFFIHSNNAVNYTSKFQEVFEDRLLF
jgi:hypothetical protein